MTDAWDVIISERKALADDLGDLSDDAWRTASLCSGWSVRDVLAHMTATTRLSAGSFVVKLVGSGFRFERVQSKGIAAERGADGAETLARFRAQAESRGRPPGPLETMLGEVIVHSEDIRRPLGIEHAYPDEALRQAAHFFAGSNLIIGGKRRAAGLTLRATDGGWDEGSGPVVSGPGIDLVLAVTGRVAALDRLEGDGLATLRERVS